MMKIFEIICGLIDIKMGKLIINANDLKLKNTLKTILI